jgi:hypothetical protein
VLTARPRQFDAENTAEQRQAWSGASEMECTCLARSSFHGHSNIIYLFIFIHSLSHLFVCLYYLFINGLPITFSVAQNFTTTNDTVSVKSISISVQNFRPTQLFLYCNTAT